VLHRILELNVINFQKKESCDLSSLFFCVVKFLGKKNRIWRSESDIPKGSFSARPTSQSARWPLVHGSLIGCRLPEKFAYSELSVK